jgi:hypothetical protein
MTLLHIPKGLLEEAGLFFEDRGSFGYEGTAMVAAGNPGFADRLVIPDQIAGDRGSWVEVTHKGKLELAAALRGVSIYVSRIHSHALEAFHSPVDDRNPILTYPGALSIVVPFYGLGLRRGLGACGVFQLTGEHKWLELEPGGKRDSVVVEVD